MNKEQSIREAGRVWRNTVSEIRELKRRIRAEAEAEIEREVEWRRAEAARAIHYARERGATKTALRQVTTKDHWDFEEYITLGAALAAEQGEWEMSGEDSRDFNGHSVRTKLAREESVREQGDRAKEVSRITITRGGRTLIASIVGVDEHGTKLRALANEEPQTSYLTRHVADWESEGWMIAGLT